MPRTVRTPAILLRSVAYSESDKIVTLLTEMHGKVSVMARGARRSKKRFSGALEPYAVIDADIAIGTGDIGRFAEARVTRSFPGILEKLSRITVAAAGLELVREVMPEHDPPNDRLIPTIVRFFELVEKNATDELRITFSVRVLALVGLGPNLSGCGICDREAPAGKAALFDPRLGALVCRACGGGPIKLSGDLRNWLEAATTEQWHAVAVESKDDMEAARRALDELLEHHLGKRLRSRDVLSQVL